MSRPIHAAHHPPEVQLSTMPLSANARSGATSITFGLRGERAHQPERRALPAWHVAFAHPPVPTTASRPYPRRA